MGQFSASTNLIVEGSDNDFVAPCTEWGSPAIVSLDLNLPGADGMGVLHLIPVMVLATLAADINVQRC